MPSVLPRYAREVGADGLTPRQRRDLDAFLTSLELVRLTYGQPFGRQWSSRSDRSELPEEVAAQLPDNDTEETDA